MAHETRGNCVGMNPGEWDIPPQLETLFSWDYIATQIFQGTYLKSPTAALQKLVISISKESNFSSHIPSPSMGTEGSNSNPRTTLGCKSLPSWICKPICFWSIAWTYPLVQVPNDTLVILISLSTEEGLEHPSHHHSWRFCARKGTQTLKWHVKSKGACPHGVYCIGWNTQKFPNSSSPASWNSYSHKEKYFKKGKIIPKYCLGTC